MLLLLAPLGGCAAYEDTTRVALRDPSQAAVMVRTPGGPVTLLPASVAPGTKDVPASAPPYLEDVKAASSVTRGEGGVVTVDCPGCIGVQGRVVMGADGLLALPGDPEHTLVTSDAMVWMRYDDVSLMRCRRGRGLCPRPALSLWVATPRTNVLAVRHEHVVATSHGERTGAKLGLGVGLALLAASVIVIADAHTLAPRAEDGLYTFGGGLGAVGGAFTAFGLGTLLARSTDEPVLLR